jgi:hypothetical protein
VGGEGELRCNGALVVGSVCRQAQAALGHSCADVLALAHGRLYAHRLAGWRRACELAQSIHLASNVWFTALIPIGPVRSYGSKCAGSLFFISFFSLVECII